MKSAAHSLRRGTPIRAYVGANGGGKTLCAVADLIPSLERGRLVYSTAPLYDLDGNLAPSYRPLTEPAQLLEIEHADVLLDEVTGVANARESTSLPPALQHLFLQLRKRDVTLSWTTPNWKRADVLIREVTQAVTYCRGFLPKSNADGWPQKRLFLWTTYESAAYDDFDAGQADKVKHLARQIWYRRPDSPIPQRYRTGDVALRFTYAAGGACIICGGRKKVPNCSCEHPDGELFAPKRAPRTPVVEAAPVGDSDAILRGLDASEAEYLGEHPEAADLPPNAWPPPTIP